MPRPPYREDGDEATDEHLGKLHGRDERRNLFDDVAEPDNGAEVVRVPAAAPIRTHHRIAAPNTHPVSLGPKKSMSQRVWKVV